MAKADTMNWYRHEHKDAYTPPQPKSRTGPTHECEDIGHKMRPHGTPDWYTTEKKQGNLMVVGSRPHSRVNTADAGEYLERNQTGTASNWFGHDPTVNGPQQCHSPRITSPEAETIAGRLKGESENWFSHDANRNYSAAKPAARGTGEAVETMEKSRGGAMQRALRGEGGGEAKHAPRSIKPEAQDIAKKSIQGLMDKFLKQDENRGYQSARPCGRAVKSEAAENATKNKGVMGDCMGGYPPMASKKKPGRAVKAEASETAFKNKGQVNNLMSQYGKLPLSDRKASRVVKPEAADNAVRNKGTMDQLMQSYGKLQLSGRPAPRLKSQAAEENAMKGKGTMGGLIQMQA